MNIIKKYKFDIILISSVLIAGVLFLLCNHFFSHNGKYVCVRVSGKELITLPLESDAVYEINGKNNGKNILKIENGSARIEDASCPDKLCVGMGTIRYVGQSVICLPNEVVVEITGDTDTNDVDVKSG